MVLSGLVIPVDLYYLLALRDLPDHRLLLLLSGLWDHRGRLALLDLVDLLLLYLPVALSVLLPLHLLEVLLDLPDHPALRVLLALRVRLLCYPLRADLPALRVLCPLPVLPYLLVPVDLPDH